MKTLYLDCGMGAAGDMLTAALLELLPEPDAFISELNGIGIPGVRIRREPSVKCGITGTRVAVTVNGEEEPAGEPDSHDHGHDHGHENDHEHEHDHGHDHDHEHGHDQYHDHGHGCHGGHSHSGMNDIERVVGELDVSRKVREDILAVYRLIAEAESHVHGVPVTEIHFHEVGAMDAVADIAAVCLLMERLAPERVTASPVNVGGGQVACAHGILPVPAPATARILRGVPSYGCGRVGELCTPTGAALLKYFVSSFGDMPVMRTEAIGCGMGKKDLYAANCVRAMLGESEDGGDRVFELRCNLDDMTAEELGFASDRLFEAGALEVYTVAVGMKKSRQGTLLCVLCSGETKEDIVRAVFRHTSTIGIRETECRRYLLERTVREIDTQYGIVRRKDSSGYGVSRRKYEYDDVAEIARRADISFEDAAERIRDSAEDAARRR